MYKIITIFTITAALLISGCSTSSNKPAATPPPPIPVPTQSDSEILAEQIQSDIDNWRLTSPKGNNAAEKLKRLRLLGAPSETISAIEIQIASRYMQLSDRALSQRDNLTRRALERALRFINTARDFTPISKELDIKEREIVDLIEIDIQKKNLADAKAKAKKKAEEDRRKEQARLKELARQKKLKDAAKASAPPPSLAMTPPVNKTVSTENMLVFNQADVDNQSQSLGLEIDNISRRIINRNASVIIHAKSERDYRWINGSLKTSIYLMRSSFNLKSTPQIGANESPSIEIVK